MGFADSWLQQFINLLVGEGELAAKRVDATYINAMGTDILRGIAIKAAHGDDAVDAGSNPARCVISVRSDNGRTGVIQAGDAFVIRDTSGTGYWYGVASADNVISFETAAGGSDGYLVRGAAPANYAAPAFIDALHIFPIRQSSFVIFSQMIYFHDTDAGGVNSNSIPRATAAPAAGSIEEGIADMETAFSVAHDIVTGVHAADAINDVSQLERNVFINQSFNNILWGNFERDSNYDGRADRWIAVGAPLFTIDTVNYRIGTQSQRIQTFFAGEGIMAVPQTYASTDYAGEYVSFTAYVQATVNNTVYLQIDDGVNPPSVSAAGGIAGTWVRLGVRHLVSAAVAPGGLTFSILANAATTFNVDGALAQRGSLLIGYQDNPLEISRAFMYREDQINWIRNSSFEDWTNGTSTLPDHWQTGVPGINPPAAAARSGAAGTYQFGQYSCSLHLANGQGIFQDILNYTDFLGMDIGVSCYIILDPATPATDTIRLKIDDGVAPFWSDFTPTLGTAMRVCCGLGVSPAATMLRLSIENQAGGAAETWIFVDGAMLHKGGASGFMIAWRPSVVYKPFERVFTDPGAIGAGLMFHHGAAIDNYPVGRDCYIDKIRVRAGTPPGGAVVDTWDVFQNGVPAGLTVTLTGAQQDNATHLPVPLAFAAADRLQVNTTVGGGSASQNIGVVVEGFRIAY